MEREQILFIYADDPASRKQARKHVSKIVRGREHRQRTKQAFIRETFPLQRYDKAKKHKAETKPDDEPDEASCRRKQRKPCIMVFDKHDGNAESLTALNKSGSRVVQPYPTDDVLDLFTGFKPRDSTIDQYFSAARTDPFCSLPIELSAESAKCLDHFNTSMPYLEFCVYEGSALIPSRHVAFRSALETPAALHAIIATAATHLAGLYGVDSTTIIQHHHGQALRLLRTDVLTVNRFSWSRVAQSMTEIAAGDDFRCQIHHSQVHLNGLRELMLSFGGISQLQATPKVQLLVCYVLNGATAAYFPSIQCSPVTLNKARDAVCDSSSTSTSKIISLLDLGLDQSQARAIVEIHRHVLDFCNFMSKIVCPKDNKVDASIIRLRRILPHYFQRDSALRQRLAVSTADQEHFGGLGPKGNHRISCLMTIVLHLLRLSKSADFQGLTLYLEKLHFFNYQNLRLLQFLLLQDGTETRMNDSEASWEVTRLMQVYKTLGEQWRQAVNDALVDLLTSDKSSEQETTLLNEGVSVPVIKNFTPNEVMDEVLRNLAYVNDGQALLLGSAGIDNAAAEKFVEVQEDLETFEADTFENG